MAEPVGGGLKKVLYTLNTVRKMGVGSASKALTSANTCKACGLGMGGLKGGMTNELGEFPSVCNKSVQAQSSDVLPAIPEAIFDHPIDELSTLGALEFNQLGRLGFPIHKAPDSDRFQRIGWDSALALAADRLAATAPERSFFYASGRSSNEAGFLFQLLARLYGTNSVNNCSYYCHQASSVALGNTIGSGTATVELADLGHCDCFLLVGANPASNHPRLIHQLKAIRERGGHVIVINPVKEPGLVRFAVPKHPGSLLRGGDEIASHYLQPKIGTDIALFTALARRLLDNGAIDRAFVAEHCDNAAAYLAALEQADLDALLEECGVSRAALEAVVTAYSRSKAAVFAWGMGLTHHTHGVANIEALSNVALLRGMVGRPGAGLLPLRGHSNVQGIGTIGVKPVLAGSVIRAIERQFNVTLPEAPGMDTMACMEAAHRGDIDAAVLLGGNLFAANPDSRWATSALNHIAFRLSLTTSLNQGHLAGLENREALILPVTARDEEWEPTTQESMFNYVRLSAGGIQRIAEARPESVVLAALAERLLPNCPIDFSAFARHRELRRAIADIVPGMADLKDIEVAKREFHIRNRLHHRPVFQTPTGRARLVQPPPAHRQRPATSTNNLDPEQHGFVLTTVRSEGQFNSIVYEEADSYRQVSHRWSIMINPAALERLGLKAGDRATIRSASGTMADVRVYPIDVGDSDAVAFYPEANVLTSRAVDPDSRTPGFKATAITIEPGDEGRSRTPE
ncbi:MAG: FdhF/YdeP family oxidoreductase [Pseudomonadota bacterium]